MAALSRTALCLGVLFLASPAFAQERPAVMVPLYVGVGLAHGLDLHSTHLALSSGRAREANPLMQHGGVRVAMKTGVTAFSIWGAERLWKSGKRKTAIVVLAGVIAGTSAVAAHNYRIGK